MRLPILWMTGELRGIEVYIKRDGRCVTESAKRAPLFILPSGVTHVARASAPPINNQRPRITTARNPSETLIHVIRANLPRYAMLKCSGSLRLCSAR